MMTTIRLACGAIEFYNKYDREIFFEYLQELDCVVNVVEEEAEIFIDIAPEKSNHWPGCIEALECLFRRYHIRTQQLAAAAGPEFQHFFTRNLPPVVEIFWDWKTIPSHPQNKRYPCFVYRSNDSYCFAECTVINACMRKHSDFLNFKSYRGMYYAYFQDTVHFQWELLYSLFVRYELYYEPMGNIAKFISPAAEQARCATEYRWKLEQLRIKLANPDSYSKNDKAELRKLAGKLKRHKKSMKSQQTKI